MTTTPSNKRLLITLAALLPAAVVLAAVVTAPHTAQAQGTSPIPPLAAPQAVRLPKITEKTLANGMRLVVLEDHRQPAVWMRLAVPAGSVRDPKGKTGTAEAVAALLVKGTATRNEAQIADTVDGLGATLGAGADADFITVSANGLSAYTDTLMGLLADVTVRPTFPDQETSLYKTQAVGGIQSALASADTLAAAALAREVYGAHPYGNFASGTAETIGSLTSADLKAFHDAYFAPNVATLFVVGDLSAGDAEKKALAAFAGWSKKTVAPAPAAPTRSQGATGSKPRIVIIDRPGAAQTSVQIGTLSTGYNDPARIPAQIATLVLGAGQFEGRLMQEIRVKRGLTYGAASGFTRNKDAGLFTIGTFTKNASTGEVVRIALDEAAKLTQTPPGASELADRKALATGSTSVRIATPDGVLGVLMPAVLKGDGAASINTVLARIQAVTPADVQKAISGASLNNAATVVLVGDAKEIRPQVEAFGPVTVIAADQLDLEAPNLQKAAQAAPTAPAASPEAANAGKAVLDAAIKAHGGEAFLNVKSLKATGKGELSPPGQAGFKIPLDAITFIAVSPDKSRLDLKSSFGDFAFASMGGTQGGWISAVGNIQDLSAAQSSSSDPTAFLRAAAKNNYESTPITDAVPVVSPDGKTLKGIAVKNDKGGITQIYVEADTNLVRRITAKTPAGDATTFLSGYKTFDGLQLPTKMEVKQGGNDFLTLTFATFEVNKPVDDAVFAKPKTP